MNPYKWVKTLFSGGIIFILMIATVWAEPMTTEKFLELHIHSSDIRYFIKYNDVKVFSEVHASPVTQVIPVNQWSYNGKNSLLVSVNFKVDDANSQLEKALSSELKISLVLREKHNGENFEHVITTFNLQPTNESPELVAASSIGGFKLDINSGYQKSNSGDIVVGEWKSQPTAKTWIRFSQPLTIDIGLDKWSYIEADHLGDDQTMSDDEYYGMIDELHLEYQKIWSLMKDENSDELLKLTSKRAEEFDAAFHLEPGSKHAEMERSLNSAFEHEDLTLSELVEKQYIRLDIIADGKVANLTVDASSEPIIYYSHTRGSFTRFYDFYFMKKNGKWQVIR